MREKLGVDLLLLQVERSQLRWFREFSRMPPSWHPLDHVPLNGETGCSGEILSNIIQDKTSSETTIQDITQDRLDNTRFVNVTSTQFG